MSIRGSLSPSTNVAFCLLSCRDRVLESASRHKTSLHCQGNTQEQQQDQDKDDTNGLGNGASASMLDNIRVCMFFPFGRKG